MSLFRLTPPQMSLCRVLVAREMGEPTDVLLEKFRADWGEEVAEGLARDTEVDAILGHDEDVCCTGESLTTRFGEAHRTMNLRIGSYLQELDRVVNLLSEQGVRIVALKNGGIARGVISCPGCCPMGDIDLLVAKEHFRDAHQLLLSEGYRFAFRSPLEVATVQHAEQHGGGEYCIELADGSQFWLELQWRPVAGRWIRPDQEPSAEELIERSLEIPGTAVRLLSPEDNLLQVCLHTAKHSFVRAPGFRLHLDVVRLVSGFPIDWDLFLKRVILLRVKTPVYISLLIPSDLLGVPIPQNVLDTLQPPHWKRKLLVNWLNRIGLFSPHEKKFGRFGYLLFNALLYDNAFGLLRGVFPAKEWMKSQYDIRSDCWLPYYYVKRLTGLLFRRLKT